MLSVRRPKIPGLLDLAWPVLAWFTNRVFAEDCEIVEMEQAAHDAQGADWNQEVFPPIRALRKLLRECGEPLSHSGALAEPGIRTLIPVCNSPNRSQVLPLKRMNCIWSTGTWSVGEVLTLMPGSSIGSSRSLIE